MGTRQVTVAWLLGIALGTQAAGAESRKVTGRVIGEGGQPVAKAEVATMWDFAEGTMMRAFHAARTDQNGRFTLKVEFWQRYQPLLAYNREHTRGGTAIVDEKASADVGEIRLGPLVRVHGRFSCNELGEPPHWANVYMNLMPGRLPLPRILGNLAPSPLRAAQCSSRNATFALALPAGHYQFNGYSSTSEYTEASTLLDLEAGQPDLNLGSIDLKPTALARQYGKPAPALHVTDAKGIGKDITLAGLRGKWVLLEFWATWCGPCVSVGLPALVEFDKEFRDHRDKFVILTFHDTSAKSLDELEPRLEQVSKLHWGGKPLPLPILLDATGQTAKNYNVRAYPTAFLIDPEGRLVRFTGRVGKDLRDKLVPLSPDRRLARELDEPLTFGIDEMPLDLALYYLVGWGDHGEVRPIPEALKAAGVDPGELIPLTLTARLTHRSWLELFLSPFSLTYEIRNGDIVLTARKSGGVPAAASARQREAAQRLEGVLTKKLIFDFRATSLADVVKTLADRTGEPFAIDPVARRAGSVDAEATVTGSDQGQPLGAALDQILKPLGMHPVIRDEVVLLTKP